MQKSYILTTNTDGFYHSKDDKISLCKVGLGKINPKIFCLDEHDYKHFAPKIRLVIGRGRNTVDKENFGEKDYVSENYIRVNGNPCHVLSRVGCLVKQLDLPIQFGIHQYK